MVGMVIFFFHVLLFPSVARDEQMRAATAAQRLIEGECAVLDDGSVQGRREAGLYIAMVTIECGSSIGLAGQAFETACRSVSEEQVAMRFASLSGRINGESGL